MTTPSQTQGSYRTLMGAVLSAAVVLFMTAACDTADSDAPSEPNTLSAEEEREGWELLFDGESLNGWRGLNMEEVPEGHWIVENGTMKKVARDSIATDADGDPPPGADLLLDRPLDSFELVFEWKASPVANSGIKYNVSEELSAAHDSPHAALGFEYQVLDDPEYEDLLEEDPSTATAGLYGLVAPESPADLNPVGEWNSGRILFDGNYGEHWLNGERVLSFELDSAEMDSALDASKWSDIDEFGTKKEEAYIVIQDHSDTVWYRNIKLRELP